MKLFFYKRKLLWVLAGLALTYLIINKTGIWEYWTWLLFRRVFTMQKPRWEHLRGKLMLEFVKPFSHTVLIQPENTKAVIIAPAQDEIPFAVIFVLSCPEASERRMWIRNTWYKWKDEYNVQVFFMIGIRSSSKATSIAIHNESNMYQDVVLDNLIETYFALPLKVLRAMKFYLTTYGNRASADQFPFFVKVDDDVFVNVPNLVKAMKSRISTLNRNGFVGGNVYQFSKLNSNPRSGYYVPYDSWDDYWYPAYASGTCYIISGKLVPKIYNKSLETQYFPMEDIFITGIVANIHLGISPVKIVGIYSFAPDLVKDDLVNSVSVAPRNTSKELMDRYFQYCISHE